MNPAVDTQRLAFILNELRLPAIKQAWLQFAERADKEAWPATRFLAALAEHEIAERDRRRIERHLQRRACRQEKPSTPSTSPPCR